jgi:integrase
LVALADVGEADAGLGHGAALLGLAGRAVCPALGPGGRWTPDLKPASRRTYRKLLDNQILPAFERAPLGGIDTLAVREWIAGLVEQGLSPSRIRNAHQVLSQILAAGVEGGRIARNPAAGVRLPRIVRRDMHFLSARQVEDLAAAIDPRYRLLVRFAAYTGLRAASWWRSASDT